MIHIHTLKQLLLCSFLILSLTCSFSQQEVSMLFVGDVMQHDGQLKAAYNTKSNTYDYNDCFKFVKPIIEQHDIAVANLEVTHGGKPYKGYPQFTAPPALSSALKFAGFDVILTANNHSCDKGSKGVIGTLDVLDELGLTHTGTFRNKAERDSTYPLILNKNGIRIALLNYTYGTNGLKVAKPLIINYIDSAMIAKDLAKVKTMNADQIIVFTHWGKEYLPLPDNYQKKWEAFIYRHGADMVIGGHPHVVQPIERKKVENKDKFTVWSLGNHISNQRGRTKDGGLMVAATLEKKDNFTKIKNTGYFLNWVFPRKEGVLKPYYILPAYDYNALYPQFLTPEEEAKMSLFLNDSRKLLSENNINVQECFLKNIPQAKAIVDKHLSEYFSVQVAKSNSPEIPENIPQTLHTYIHRIALKDGSYVFVSGMCDDIDSARGNLNFLTDCKLDNLQLIRVKPNFVILAEK